MPTITINGESKPFPNAHSLADLLSELGLTGKRVAVERNGEIVPKGLHSSTSLSEGDCLEIVVAVGGG